MSGNDGFTHVCSSNILFSQGSIGNQFHDGISIYDQSKHTASVIKVIRLPNGQMVAVNNRSLFNQREAHGKKSVKVRFCEEDKKLLRRIMRRKNGDGLSVKVRKGGS